jgi:hypothetical protein
LRLDLRNSTPGTITHQPPLSASWDLGRGVNLKAPFIVNVWRTLAW